MSEHDSFPLPKVSEVASALMSLNAEIDGERGVDAEIDGERGVDVRLQVYEDGTWALRWGPSDYDQDHRGFWGAGSLPGAHGPFDARALAKELIEQVADDVACGRGA